MATKRRLLLVRNDNQAGAMVATWLNSQQASPLAKVLGEALTAVGAWQRAAEFEQIRRLDRLLRKQSFRGRARVLLKPARLSIAFEPKANEGSIFLRVLELSEAGKLAKLKRCPHPDCGLWFFGKGKFHHRSCRQAWYRDTPAGREKHNAAMCRYRASPSQKEERKKP